MPTSGGPGGPKHTTCRHEPNLLTAKFDHQAVRALNACDRFTLNPNNTASCVDEGYLPEDVFNLHMRHQSEQESLEGSSCFGCGLQAPSKAMAFFEGADCKDRTGVPGFRTAYWVRGSTHTLPVVIVTNMLIAITPWLPGDKQAVPAGAAWLRALSPCLLLTCSRTAAVLISVTSQGFSPCSTVLKHTTCHHPSHCAAIFTGNAGSQDVALASSISRFFSLLRRATGHLMRPRPGGCCLSTV